MINLTPLVNNSMPGWAQPLYEECGYNYCMPIETCRSVLHSSQFLYRIVDVGVLICVLILIIFCEYYFRQTQELKKKLDEKNPERERTTL